MHRAAYRGDVVEVAYWLDRGTNIALCAKYHEGEHELTPLHVAAIGGGREVIELLLRRGAEVDARSSAGLTPLSYAVGAGHKAAAEAGLEMVT